MHIVVVLYVLAVECHGQWLVCENQKHRRVHAQLNSLLIKNRSENNCRLSNCRRKAARQATIVAAHCIRYDTNLTILLLTFNNPWCPGTSGLVMCRNENVDENRSHGLSWK